ncbi:MAG: hypothetical protein ABFD07_01540 [Methanobacterium sp.]
MVLKQSLRKTEPYRYNANYKMKYPGPEFYNFPTGPKHNSPCMDSFWRSKPIREGKKMEE